MENIVLEKILNQILCLPLEYQVQIVNLINKNIALQVSVENNKWHDDIPKWQQNELNRRIKNIENGATKTFSWEEVEHDLDVIIESELSITV